MNSNTHVVATGLRIMAAWFVILAALVWWHPMSALAQSATLAGLAFAVAAHASKAKQVRLIRQKLAEAQAILRSTEEPTP